MASISPPYPPMAWITGTQQPRTRSAWSRRNYHERLNLRRIAVQQQQRQSALEVAHDRGEVAHELR